MSFSSPLFVRSSVPWKKLVVLFCFCIWVSPGSTSMIHAGPHLESCQPHPGSPCPVRNVAHAQAFALSSFSITVPPIAEPLTNLVSVIDAMVLYTPAAREGAGGASEMESLIDLAVAEANTVYQNSRANVRLRLAYSGEIDYTEHPNIATNLNRLQGDTDGFMDEVHKLRDTNRADIVCLITETADNGIGGLAFTMGEASILFKPLAFCIVKRSEIAGNYTFAHEIGHVLGCQHDRENSFEEDGTFKSGAFPYSHAHRFTVDTNVYRTVMAHSPGEIVPYFSNPDLLFGGVPIGEPGTTNGANNTLTLNLTGPLVSSFYGPATTTVTPLVSIASPAGGAVFQAGADVGVTIEAADVDGEIQRIELFAGNRLVGITTNALASEIILPGLLNPITLTNFTFNLIWTNPPNGEFQLTARAVDNRGASSVSLPLQVTLRPQNDSFVQRLSLGDSEEPFEGSNLAATVDPGEAAHTSNPGGSSVWYSWKAPRTGTVRATAVGAGILPLPEVYKSLNSTSLTTVTLKFEFSKTNFTSRAMFDAVAGETYAIAVDAVNGKGGPFTLTLAYEPPPENDNFADRKLISGESIQIEASNTTAGFEAGEPMHGAPNPSGKSVWYKWSIPRAGTVTVSTTGTEFFPIVDVYTGESISLLTNVPGRKIDFDIPNNTAILTFEAAADQEYSIAVAGFAANGGRFVMTLAVPPPPSNDNFENRVLLSGTSIELETSNRYATKEPSEPAQHAGQNAARSIWFSWTAPVSGPVTLKTAAAGFYALPEVYTGGVLNELSNVVNRTLDFDTNLVSTLVFDAVAFRTYHIAVDAFDSPGGKMTFSLNTANTPPAVLSSASNAGIFSLRIAGSQGQGFVVQASENLVDWSEIFRGTFSSDVAQFTDTDSNSNQVRFYRVFPAP